jgi:outer membrane lipoprotein-sorting protein
MMNLRALLMSGLALACLVVAGCGNSAATQVDPEVVPLTQADRAAYQAGLDSVADEEKAHQAKDAPGKAKPALSEEAVRARQGKN